ncbi:hypothetical protein [Streptomyces sp. Tu102]|uniref:hypothetical protein n=1 Tax=Streptomyces TaxID=1883 RepID=UPI001BDC6D43|nr:hypothetical protein [Streptomyces sp. Tu102]MBT1098154.1 hypothetical protein [Streptomyces sp. Tu102]
MLITPNPATPEGEAIIDLADLLDGLHERTGEWPGADTVDILGEWLSRISFGVSEDFAQQVTGRAWVLHQWDRHSDEVTLWADEASAVAALARGVRSSWDNVAGTDGVPYRPPADDRTAVDLYYGPKQERGDEDYVLFVTDIARRVRTPTLLSLADPDSCAQANSSAVFHAQEGPDDEGLPCIEIAGILVFSYLDADRGAVRVSVHLDTADEELVRADTTVPIEVEIEDTTVFSSLTAPPASTRTPGWRARIRRLARRVALHDSGQC